MPNRLIFLKMMITGNGVTASHDTTAGDGMALPDDMNGTTYPSPSRMMNHLTSALRADRGARHDLSWRDSKWF
jgi:hypothetical protein